MAIITNSKISVFLSYSILFILLLVVSSSSIYYSISYIPSEPHPANAMWIEPSNATIVDIGDKFNVTVFVNLTQNSFAWQIKLFFNSTFLTATKTGYTNGNKSNFFSEHSSIIVTPTINNEEGFILQGESLLGNDEKASGYGSLIWIEFNLTQIPPQDRSTIYFSIPYGADTFILTPYIELVPMDSVSGVNLTIKSTSLPQIPDFIALIVITLILVTVVAILVIMRKRRRKSKDSEKNQN